MATDILSAVGWEAHAGLQQEPNIDGGKTLRVIGGGADAWPGATGSYFKKLKDTEVTSIKALNALGLGKIICLRGMLKITDFVNFNVRVPFIHILDTAGAIQRKLCFYVNDNNGICKLSLLNGADTVIAETVNAPYKVGSNVQFIVFRYWGDLTAGSIREVLDAFMYAQTGNPNPAIDPSSVEDIPLLGTVQFYTGDGAASRSITSGSALKPPKIVITKGNTATEGKAACRTATLTTTRDLVTQGSNDSILSLDAAGGFTVKYDVAHAFNTNENAISYYGYQLGGADVETGTYVGNGGTKTVPLGFAPVMVWVFPSDGTETRIKTTTMAGLTVSFGSAVYNDIADLTSAESFDVSTAALNTNATTYHYVAIRGSDFVQVGTYTGNGGVERLIPTALRSILVCVKRSTNAAKAVFSTSNFGPDSCIGYDSTGLIGSPSLTVGDTLASNNFRVDNIPELNTNTAVYHWFAFELGGQAFLSSPYYASPISSTGGSDPDVPMGLLTVRTVAGAASTNNLDQVDLVSAQIGAGKGGSVQTVWLDDIVISTGANETEPLAIVRAEPIADTSLAAWTGATPHYRLVREAPTDNGVTIIVSPEVLNAKDLEDMPLHTAGQDKMTDYSGFGYRDLQSPAMIRQLRAIATRVRHAVISVGDATLEIKLAGRHGAAASVNGPVVPKSNTDYVSSDLLWVTSETMEASPVPWTTAKWDDVQIGVEQTALRTIAANAMKISSIWPFLLLEKVTPPFPTAAM